MDAMTVDASGYVEVVFIHQSMAMNAFQVFVIDAGMAIRTSFWNFGTRLVGRGGVVSAVTIGADRCIPVAGGNLPGMNAI
jgi:hypothetical protein